MSAFGHPQKIASKGDRTPDGTSTRIPLWFNFGQPAEAIASGSNILSFSLPEKSTLNETKRK
jgi:hypothetical protein